ncbi:MAG: nuclear transport factor 2 family protein [Rhodoferax sp.]
MNTSIDSPAHTIDKVLAYFETLSPQSLAQLSHYYAPQARFKDPFNDVTGLKEITRIFAHMFVSLVQPRFVITERVQQGMQCFVTWEFRFEFRGFHKHREQVILGASHLVFDAQGLVVLHRDYWDAAEELYEKLPLVGSLMRWLKRRANS